MNGKTLTTLGVAGLLAAASMTQPVAAAGTKKALEAYYDVQIEYNSQALNSDTAPFIVDGTTYVPLRMLMNTFGDKQITWDNANRKVVITGTTSQSEQMYNQQITSRNTQITQLQTELAALKAERDSLLDELDDLEDEDLDLDDLEDDLNDDYGDYDDYSIDITIGGDEDDIEVDVDIDNSDWDTLTATEQESLLQHICDDIWNEAEDADITGTITDGSTELGTFTAEAGEDVEADADTDLSDLEDTLNDDYSDYDDITLDISLDGDSDDIELVIEVDEDEWDTLTTTEAESLLQNICDDIWDEYEDASIDGSIEDGSTSLDSFSVDADDDLEL